MKQVNQPWTVPDWFYFEDFIDFCAKKVIIEEKPVLLFATLTHVILYVFNRFY